jgi:hypothetical protein
MKRQGTIGAALFVAIAAVVGHSIQPGTESGKASQNSAARPSKPSIEKRHSQMEGPGCSSLQEELEDFLGVEDLVLPQQCYVKGAYPPKQHPAILSKASRLKFVIALMPDPVHTHSSALFDQFAVAIQEAAQDEKYDFDSSWLPWDDQESSYALLADDKDANRERMLKEDQPGIILFRKTPECSEEDLKNGRNCAMELSKSYEEGLIVFVVGEEATHGIHQEQFYNALQWISALQPKDGAAPTETQLAILGPTFSGSLPSVAQVLTDLFDVKRTAHRDLDQVRKNKRLAIFSGSVSSKLSATVFQRTFDPPVVFHSFVQNDDKIVDRFCRYMRAEQPGFDGRKFAIVSEDETAYGGFGLDPENKDDKDDGAGCGAKALRLYYPRDISALRGAYQTKSLFDAGTSPQTADTQRRTLPSDLADPAGKVHDSIRSYGGNQTPLAQEASLMEIVTALRELHSRYILLRSSTTVDQLFLTNFLRRSYPDGRIVILGSDLMFIRERGATGLSGSMTLSTYPLFPLERDWTEHESLPAADRVFSSDTAEGTYVALRLLLNDESLNKKKSQVGQCRVFEEKEKDKRRIFLPRISCKNDPPVPDYSPPFWTLKDQCGELVDQTKKTNTGDACVYPGPATWLSVVGVNRFWPLASLTSENADLKASEVPTVSGEQSKLLRLWEGPQTNVAKTERASDPGGRPEMPLGMKVFVLALAGFSVFHAFCCWFGSYTARPAFRAHFASDGDWRHSLLVFAGSACVGFLAIVAGGGSGAFYEPVSGLAYPWLAHFCVIFVCLAAVGAMLGNAYTVWRLSADKPNGATSPKTATTSFIIRMCVATILILGALQVFYQFIVVRAEAALRPENRVLTYWRAMHLASGVSPVVPMILILAGLYLSFWFTLHGLALFGPDRPCLPSKKRLQLFGREHPGLTLRNRLAPKGESKSKDFLRMFSQEDAGEKIEQGARPLNWKIGVAGLVFFVLLLLLPWLIADGVPIRSLGSDRYSVLFLVGLNVCCSLALVETWRLYQAWEELRRLLAFLDRLPLRRTLAVLHGFSWGSVWRMSGNVLEVRYKVISRQMECMNHTIEALRQLPNTSTEGAKRSLAALRWMRRSGMKFAQWYSTNYAKSHACDLSYFSNFQKSIAAASGTLFAELLVPAWRREKASLLAASAKEVKDEASPDLPPQSNEEHIRNAEEFVCLNFLGFVQNVLGRLRTMAMTIVALFLSATAAISAYPFDPRQPLSVFLIVMFVITGVVIVKVYAEMHRDATLSHVTNTKPGELGVDFWLKIIGFGLAPLIGLLTRIFPGITDFVFSWLQPSISSLK